MSDAALEVCHPAVRVAILIDGGFFLKRHRYLYRCRPGFDPADACKVAADMYQLACDHARGKYLYRILYYDCHPFDKAGVHNPISKRTVDFANTSVAQFRRAFFEELKKKRKMALRLGQLKDRHGWVISPEKTKDLLRGRITLQDLSANDIQYNIQQKGVDIRMGLDIASLAYKRLVDQVVLVTGDSDFVPAAKLARREGVDVVLDSMWNHIDDFLYEHIDGLKSHAPAPPRNQLCAPERVRPEK